MAFARDDVGFYNLAPLRIGTGDNGAIGNRPVFHQYRLDFRAGNVVASGYDHVVGARLIPEIAIFIEQITVTG